MKKIPAFTGLILCLLAFSCKNDPAPDKGYISVVSQINRQVAHVDTSLYSIVKIVTTDSLPPDTSYIPREKFAEEAAMFLEIPDLSLRKVAKRYNQEPPVYDEALNRVIFNYTATDPEEEYVSQQMLVEPDLAKGDKVKNVLVTRIVNKKNLQEKYTLLWIMDKKFQVAGTSRKTGEPEHTRVVEVTWNAEESF